MAEWMGIMSLRRVIFPHDFGRWQASVFTSINTYLRLRLISVRNIVTNPALNPNPSARLRQASLTTFVIASWHLPLQLVSLCYYSFVRGSHILELLSFLFYGKEDRIRGSIALGYRL